MVTKTEVRHIAKLARLGLSEKEIEKFKKELSRILDYVEKLKQVDVSEIKEMSHSVLIENVQRQDLPKDEDLERRKKIMETVPEKKNGYLKTKSIL